MKKLLLVLAMSVSMVFIACNNKDEPNIEEEYHKIVIEYAKQNNFDLDDYEEFIFKLNPHYDISDICIKYSNILKDRENSYNYLVENENSALYEKIRLSEYTSFYIFANFSYAIKHNRKFIQEDIEWLEFFTSTMDNFYKDVEICNNIIGYTLFWMYSADNNIKQKYYYGLQLPTLNNINFNVIKCVDLIENDEVQSLLSMYRTDEELHNALEKVQSMKIYENKSEYNLMNWIIEGTDFEYFKKYNEKLKAYLSIIKR